MKRNKRAHERGAAAVEFALVFVMLMTMLFALVEGGIIFMHQASVSAAAREGVRMMAITNDVDAAISAAEDAYPWGPLDDTPDFTPDTCPDPPDRSKSITVVVHATPTFTLGIFGKPQLIGVGEMRCGG